MGLSAAGAIRIVETKCDAAVSTPPVGDSPGSSGNFVGEFGLVPPIGCVVGNGCTPEGWQGGTNWPGPWLRVDLAVPLDHLAMKSAIQIGVLLGGMVVVATVGAGVPIAGIKFPNR